MKISCSQTALLNSVNVVSKAVPVKTTMPILECILLRAYNGRLILTSSNMDLGIENYVPDGQVEEEGIVALDAKLFSDVVRNLPKSTVYIETDDHYHTTIRCEKAEYKVVGKSGQDFPLPQVVKVTDPIEISQYSLGKIIHQTSFSVAENDANKMMTGMLLEIHENKLKIVALDGHRISIRVLEMKKTYPDYHVIVPGKSMSEIYKILGTETDEMAMIYITQAQIVFEIENTTMVVRLIEGEYFHYEQMMRAEYNTMIAINRRDFIESITRATLLVKEGEKKPVIVSIKDGEIELIGNSAVGSMTEMLPAVKEGADLMIGFNPKFLLEALRAIDDEEIKIYMIDAKSPCFIRNDEETYNYIVLPVNFNNYR